MLYGSGMNLGKRLKEELTSRGMKAADLCRLVPDMDIRTLSASISRDSRRSDYAPAIARVLGLRLEWLLTGSGEKFETTSPPPPARAPAVEAYPIGRGRPVPVIGNGQGGLPERVWDDQGYPVGASEDYAEVATGDERAFIVRVRGDSMSPKYEPGEYALVEPGTVPDVGDDVLVRLNTGETMIKRLDRRGGGGIRLASYNNNDRLFFRDEEITWLYWVPHPVPTKKIKSRS